MDEIKDFKRLERMLLYMEGYESARTYIGRMKIHEGFMCLVVRPRKPFMIHAGFALRLIGGQTPMHHKYTLAMLGGFAVNTCYDTCSPTPVEHNERPIATKNLDSC